MESKNAKLRETEARMVDARAGTGGNGEMLVKRSRYVLINSGDLIYNLYII